MKPHHRHRKRHVGGAGKQLALAPGMLGVFCQLFFFSGREGDE